ncbi:MAG: hypothetical protein CSA20_04445 [Deltaproteobacteria bacterium]|nr:MAG: hypothetical protein CSA20_04445 [Deltaproteobacteria bacterium]
MLFMAVVPITTTGALFYDVMAAVGFVMLANKESANKNNVLFTVSYTVSAGGKFLPADIFLFF